MDDTEPNPEPAAASYGDLPGEHVTVNQIVALNMIALRKAAALTQDELGKKLGWSSAVVSAAERSADGKRVRQFTVGDIMSLAAVFDVPVTALLLPPQDDGVDHRYLTHVPESPGAGVTVESDCWDMHTLMMFALSEPTDDKTRTMQYYRERYVTAVNAYMRADEAAELAEYAGDLTTEDRISAHLAKLRRQYEALKELLGDNDHIQEELYSRLRRLQSERFTYAVRTERCDPDLTHAARESDRKIGEIINEMYGPHARLTRAELERAVAEAERRGVFADEGDSDGTGT